MSTPKIAIIGAGPAGCTLARLLHLASVSVTVFEGEAGLDSRTQGGTLDLHTHTGIAALKVAGLYDAFLKHARFDGEAFMLCDKALKRYINMRGTKEGSTRGRPEIDRMQLRRMLIDSLPEGVIRWNSRLRTIEDRGGTFLLHFDHGVECNFDLIVGADGAWSKVRPLISSVKPFFSGVGGVSLTISDPKERCSHLYRLVNRGSVFGFSDGKMLAAQQMGDGKLSVGAWSVRNEDWMETFPGDLRGLASVKEALLKHYEDWAIELKEIIRMADGDVVPRSFFMLPVGCTWQNRLGVTLLGDAAHLMTPFAGEGVNLAMQDAMMLAQAIVDAVSSKQEHALRLHIKAYEENMFKRATKVQKMTHDMMSDMFFTPGAPETTIERYIMHAMEDSVHPLFYPAIFVIVYIYFWCFRLWHRYIGGWRGNVRVMSQQDLRAVPRGAE